MTGEGRGGGTGDTTADRRRVVWARVRMAGALLAGGRAGAVFGAVRRRVWSTEDDWSLRRDLGVRVAPPTCEVTIEVRPAEAADIKAFFSEGGAGRDAAGALWRQRRVASELRAGLPGCHVALTPDGDRCLVMWVFTSRENRALGSLYGGEFAELKDDEVLLERIFTREDFRGQGIMTRAVWQVCEQARARGARWALTFVGSRQSAAGRGFEKAGFVPWMRRRDEWRLFRHRFVFRPLDPAGATGP